MFKCGDNWKDVRFSKSTQNFLEILRYILGVDEIEEVNEVMVQTEVSKENYFKSLYDMGINSLSFYTVKTFSV